MFFFSVSGIAAVLIFYCASVEVYPGRSYYGGPTHECRYYRAVFWFQERVKRASNLAKRKIVYNLCCRGRGKINLKPYKKPPTPLADLLKFDGDARSKRFLKQIRSYNSLFAFTFMLQFVIYIFLSSYMLSICLPTETLFFCLLID